MKNITVALSLHKIQKLNSPNLESWYGISIVDYRNQWIKKCDWFCILLWISFTPVKILIFLFFLCWSQNFLNSKHCSQSVQTYMYMYWINNNRSTQTRFLIYMYLLYNHFHVAGDGRLPSLFPLNVPGPSFLGSPPITSCCANSSSYL